MIMLATLWHREYWQRIGTCTHLDISVRQSRLFTSIIFVNIAMLSAVKEANKIDGKTFLINIYRTVEVHIIQQIKTD